MSNRRSSPIWDYFTLHDDNKKARCSICRNNLSYTCSSIGNLHRHMRQKHPTVTLSERVQNRIPEMRELIDMDVDDPGIPAGAQEQSQIRPSASSPPTINPPQPSVPAISPQPSAPAISPQPSTPAIPPQPSAPAIPPQRPTATARQQTSMRQFVVRPIPASRRNQLDNQLLRTIAKEYYPFRIVEDEEFKTFIHMLNPEYTMPTRKTLSQVIFQTSLLKI